MRTGERGFFSLVGGFVKRIEGFISSNLLENGFAGAFRTDGALGIKGVKATLYIDVPAKRNAVYQIRYKNNYGNWLITRRLYTKAEAASQFEGSTEYEIHAGPFEVPR
jgi:hypothetical protein